MPARSGFDLAATCTWQTQGWSTRYNLAGPSCCHLQTSRHTPPPAGSCNHAPPPENASSAASCSTRHTGAQPAQLTHLAHAQLRKGGRRCPLWKGAGCCIPAPSPCATQTVEAELLQRGGAAVVRGMTQGRGSRGTAGGARGRQTACMHSKGALQVHAIKWHKHGTGYAAGQALQGLAGPCSAPHLYCRRSRNSTKSLRAPARK